MLFFVIKNYYLRLNLELFKVILTKTIAYARKEIRNANNYLNKLKALKKFLRTKLQ